ncbi:MAG TPA: hypothetical protein VH478_17515 [Trebonia sp.]|jgi:hypothetical protein|nr:hypothetical protein [Trebonia sp.]
MPQPSTSNNKTPAAKAQSATKVAAARPSAAKPPPARPRGAKPAGTAKPAATAAKAKSAPATPAAGPADEATRPGWRSWLGLSTAPTPVRRAVVLMLAGAAATLAWGLYWVVIPLAARNELIAFYMSADNISRAKATAQVNGGLAFSILETVVFAAIWVLMARLNRSGILWSRIASTVLFLLWSYQTYQIIATLGSHVSYIVLGNMIITLLIWLAGASSLYFMWRPDAAAHYKKEPAPARA